MNIDDLPVDVQFLFVVMMQAAIKADDMGLNEEKFLEFARGCWESMKMNNKEYLRETLTGKMMDDLQEFFK